MSSTQQYTTVEIIGQRKYDAVMVHDGRVVERMSFGTLAAAERQADLSAVGIEYRPPSAPPARGGFDRGGFDRTAMPTPDPVEVPMPGLLPAPEEEPQPQADDQAEACDCFGCLFYGRCTADMALLASVSVQDLGIAARPGPAIPAWELEMDRRLNAKDAAQSQLESLASEAVAAGCEAGRVERAVEILDMRLLAYAERRYQSSASGCNCADSLYGRSRKCKHQIAFILQQRLDKQVN